jgi:hypothetical protein
MPLEAHDGIQRSLIIHTRVEGLIKPHSHRKPRVTGTNKHMMKQTAQQPTTN